MSSILFAMPPPEVFLAIPLGVFLIVVVAVMIVVHSYDREARRPRKGPPRNIAGRLALYGLFIGPLVGFALAWVMIRLVAPEPSERSDLLFAATLVGVIAGLFVAAVFAFVGLVMRSRLGEGDWRVKDDLDV